MFLLEQHHMPTGPGLENPFWSHEKDSKNRYAGFCGPITNYDMDLGEVYFKAGSLIFRYAKYRGELEQTIAKVDFSVQCESFDYLLFDGDKYLLGPGQARPVHMLTAKNMLADHEERIEKMVRLAEEKEREKLQSTPNRHE